MTWFKVDDGFYDHPKVKSLPRGSARKGALALWTLAGSWCGRYGTDGLVPSFQVEELGCAAKDAESLCAAALWHAPDHECEQCPDVPQGHYLFHSWPEYQPLKTEVESQKAKARERMRRRRSGESSTSTPSEPTADVREMFARTTAERAR